MLKIASFNVNGLRSAISKGLYEFLDEQAFDIVCFQETKAEKSQLDNQFLDKLGYFEYWHSAQKKGYSGVACFSRLKPDNVIYGMGIEKYDQEGRVIRLDYGELSVLNCYFPSGSSGEDRHAFKMEFLEDFGNWSKELLIERPNIIILGDYNIVHQRIDIHNPDRKDNPSGYRPEERKWLDDWLKNNELTDVFRYLNPDKKEFSWWSYRAGSRKKNLGWRIDYIVVSKFLKERIRAAYHIPQATHSDHCPVAVEIDSAGLL